MVVAEVPLWVVHSNANTPGAKNQKAAPAAASSNGNSNGTTSGTKASDSLLLLDGSAANANASGSLQKAAIYSVDVHGSRFATGGGDGTVRIWNVGALFPKPKTLKLLNCFYRSLSPAINSFLRTYDTWQKIGVLAYCKYLVFK